jgi:hypothetical protein
MSWLFLLFAVALLLFVIFVLKVKVAGAYPWIGLGRAEALLQEARRIEFLLGQGCVLANVAGNSRRVSVEQILQYLGVE